MKTKTRKQSLKSLQKEADKTYQEVLIELKPHSIISGEPTEVIHHYIRKSQSAALRYDYPNGIPLTNKEHARLHLTGDPNMIAIIIAKNGMDWHEDLQKRRQEICRTNKGYLKAKIEELKR